MKHEIGYCRWPFTRNQCIEKLLIAGADKPSLSYNLEWIALSVETFAVEHNKGVLLSESSELLSSIAASLDSVPNKHLMATTASKHSVYETICDVLRASLCLPYSLENLERANRLYALLPKPPIQHLFDAYVMYQVTFGYTNQLHDWNDHFTDLQKKSGLNALNRVQLDYGLALVSRTEENISQLRPALISSFETYTDGEYLLNGNEKIQTARSRLNWLLLYSSVCSGQLIPDSILDRASAFAGSTPSLN
ncbi:hypothetical protein LMJ53_15480 [Rheinheimera sp. UJ51]|uniref:hypothetical protein n=1 Tax=Rheinheimera sp. UJ51 TaxID=2892446 RepID=UPI001E514897|nr:hypothetical protein [Rheinheimera sp. UJ51]MCC5453123.1 hypothetical protein [Rheinheimera sp. UJ51]